MVSRRFSRALGITNVGFQVTTSIFLAMSLTLLVTNVLRVPNEEDKVVTVHFYDDSGYYRFIVCVISILIGYSTLQTVLAILQMMCNRDPSFVCFYHSESFSSVLLLILSIVRFISTRSDQKFLRERLGDATCECDGYFVKSYTSDSMLLLALICKLASLFVFSCGHLMKTYNMSSKVNVVIDEP